MKHGITTALVLLVPWLSFAQFSPPPVIEHFGGIPLDSLVSMGDSTFCRGSVIDIHGAHFTSTDTNETYQSTEVWLGGYGSGFLCQNPTVSDTLISFVLPPHLTDTCFSLIVRKSTASIFGSIPYAVTDTICSVGDSVALAYVDSVFCLGDTNPKPTQMEIEGDSGNFFILGGSGNPGFSVEPSGEIPLHSSVIGTHHFGYATGHPACPDTEMVSVSIRPQLVAHASIDGATNVASCPAGGLQVDSLFPVGGLFQASGGLVLVNDSLGILDLSGTPPGRYELWYVPKENCYDSALIEVEVLVPDTASVIYPLPFVNNVQSVCKNAPVLTPIFQTGYAGGNFVSLPSGIAFGPGGTVDPSASDPGLYTVVYHTLGLCPDTAVVSLNLSIDTVQCATFHLTEEEICQGTALLEMDSIASPGLFEVLHDDTVYVAGSGPSLPIGSLPPGRTYHVRHATGGQCPDTVIHHFTLVPADDATFSYNPAFYCLGDADPTPLIQGNGGGVFNGLSAGTVVGSDGRLFLSASGPGVHTIEYMTFGQCPDTSTFDVTINNGVSAVFSYPASLLCTADSIVFPSLTNTGGVFYIDSLGLDLDSLSGCIDPVSSQPGTYNVTYAFNNSCQTQYTVSISIGATDSTTYVVFQPDTFCKGAAFPVPLLTGDSIGQWVLYGGAVFYNSNLGSVDLQNSPAGGPYRLKFDLQDHCAVDPEDTFFIAEPPHIQLDYPHGAVCQGDAPFHSQLVAVPATTGTGGAYLTFSSELALDVIGTIDPAGSLPGSYTVYYTSPGFCPGMDSASIQINPLPTNVRMDVLPGNSICEDDTVEVRVSAADGVNYGFLLGGDTVQGAFNVFYSNSLVVGDTVMGWVENGFGCTDWVSVAFSVSARPSVSFDPESVTVGADEVIIDISSNLDMTLGNWWLVEGNAVLDSGTIALNAVGATPLALFPQATGLLDLSRLQLLVKPISGGCTGEVDSLELLLLANNDNFFIPEVITPQGDGINDQWNIGWADHIDPSRYALNLFNRSGGRVARIAPLAPSWEPGNLPDGVYWWSLIDQLEQEPPRRGGLTIVRRK